MKTIFLGILMSFSAIYSASTHQNAKILAVLPASATFSSSYVGKVYWEVSGVQNDCNIKKDGRENYFFSVALTHMTTGNPVKLQCTDGYLEYIRAMLPDD